MCINQKFLKYFVTKTNVKFHVLFMVLLITSTKLFLFLIQESLMNPNGFILYLKNCSIGDESFSTFFDDWNLILSTEVTGLISIIRVELISHVLSFHVFRFFEGTRYRSGPFYKRLKDSWYVYFFNENVKSDDLSIWNWLVHVFFRMVGLGRRRRRIINRALLFNFPSKGNF